MATPLHRGDAVATKVLERYQVAPPMGSVPAPAPLPLTAFDVFFCPLQDPVQRAFFYRIPLTPCHTKDDAENFLRFHILPTLKRSLPRALQSFYPVAGRLVTAPGSAVPSSLCYAEGDWVELTVAQCEDDFASLTKDGVKDASLLRGLAPCSLPPDGGRGQPVLALQVTLFPAATPGFAVGVTTHQAAVDGHSVVHFMRTWAGLCRGEDGGAVEPPRFDRSPVVAEPGGLGQFLLEVLQGKSAGENQTPFDDLHGKLTRVENEGCGLDAVHATFRLGKAQLNGMRRWVAERGSSHGGGAFVAAQCSPFALATALIWTAAAKARPTAVPKWLVFLYGVRGHIGQPAAVPLNYFGNCVGTCVVEAKSAGELLAEDGLATAATAVWDAILGLNRKGVLESMQRVARFFRALAETSCRAEESVMIVAGSPKLGSYGVDFGWGRPEKIEMVSIGAARAMSLSEWEEGGGFEVGMVLHKSEMELFAARLADSLRMCSTSGVAT